MPELPEVETVRRGLEAVLLNRRIAAIEMHRADLRFPLPAAFAERLTGQRVIALERRAKYLVARLSSGDDLVMHLGMTGRFTICHQSDQSGTEEPAGNFDGRCAGEKHDHVVLHVSGGSRIVYSDPRRFGFMLLIPATERPQHALFRGLGVEPVGDGLTPEYLARRAWKRKTSLKAFLMDQRIVAGLGNIYVCEALYRAGLSPMRMTRTLADRRGLPTRMAERLAPAVRQVIADALAAGGSTLRDYRHADGRPGEFQNLFAVYGREGERCRRKGCGGIVRRCVQGGRSTFYCPRCQR